MTVRLGDAEYVLRRVGDDEIEVRADDALVGAFSWSEAESGVRVRTAARNDAAAVHTIARAWLESEARRALAREPRGGSALVVTEDAPFRNFLALALRRRGYEVDCVGSAAEARALVTRRFGVVVAAADLGDGTGVEVLAWYRRHSGARTVALVEEVPAVADKLAGVDAYVQVPCHVVAIVQTVERLGPE